MLQEKLKPSDRSCNSCLLHDLSEGNLELIQHLAPQMRNRLPTLDVIYKDKRHQHSIDKHINSCPCPDRHHGNV